MTRTLNAGALRLGLISCCLILFAGLGITPQAYAQCVPEPQDCSTYTEDARIRDIAIDGCVMRVFYRIIECDGDCTLTIDRIEYLTLEAGCSNCVNDLDAALFDDIINFLLMHGVYFNPCGVYPSNTFTIAKPACWIESSGSGTGGTGGTTMTPCGVTPCCSITYTVVKSNGVVIGTIAGPPTTTPPGPYDCRNNGTGCVDTCN